MNWKSIISIMVAVIITAGVFIPVVSASTQEHISIKQVNDGAADVDLGYFVQDENKTSPEVYPGAANVTVTNGVITLTYFESGTTTENKIENTITATDAILALAVSDTNLTQIALFIKDSKVYFCDCTIITTPREVKYCAISADRTVSTGNFYLTCSVKFVDGSSSSGSRAVDWAYLPALGGAYGSYTGGLAYELSDVVSVGYFADVFIASKNSTLCTFNDYDLSATIERDADGGVTGVKYARATAEAAAVDGSASAYTGEDPVILTPDDDDGTVAVLTPEEWDGGDAAASTTATSATSGDLNYMLTDATATVTGPVDKTVTSITIPETVTLGNTTYAVTAIGSSAFSGCTSLTSVNLGQVTTIGAYAFFSCGLSSVTIPASVTAIGSSAFSKCANLTSINVSSSNSYYSSIDGVLYAQSGSTIIQYPTGKTNSEFIAPTIVKSVGTSAFRYNPHITTINLSTVTSLAISAFNECTSLSTVSLGQVRSIGQDVFSGCTSLALTSLPSSVTSIGTSAFSGCTSLALTSLPSSVTSIGTSAFSGCTSLALTSLPSSVTSIGDSAFRECTSLALTSLPSSVTSIGDSAFRECTSLALTSLPSSVTSIGTSAFYRVPLATLVIQSSPTIGKLGFGSTGLAEVLNLGSTTLTTTMGITDSTVVSDNIESLAIIQQKEHISDTLEQKDGAVYDLINILPIIILAGLAIATVRMCISRWD